MGGRHGDRITPTRGADSCRPRPWTPGDGAHIWACRWTVQPFSTVCRGCGHVTVDTVYESAFLRKDPALWSPPQVALLCGLTLPPTPAPSHPGHNSWLEAGRAGGGSSLGRPCGLRGGCLSSLLDLSSLRCLAPGPASETQCRPLMKGPWWGGCGQNSVPTHSRADLRDCVTAGGSAPEASHGSTPRDMSTRDS